MIGSETFWKDEHSPQWGHMNFIEAEEGNLIDQIRTDYDKAYGKGSYDKLVSSSLKTYKERNGNGASF